MNRRSFLKGAGVASLSMMAAGAAATGAFAEEASIVWDKEVDVLVVGAGTAAYAGIFAKDFGAESVCIIDKGRFGGTASTSGGVLWVPCFYGSEGDTPEAAMGYMQAVAAGRGNQAAMDAYLENANPMCEHMRDVHGWDLVATPGPVGFFDYYEPLEGATVGVRQVTLGGGVGFDMWSALSDLTEELGIEVITKCAATELVTDETGRVVGVVADNDGTPMNIKANKGVVLGTGGFDYNEAMVKSFQTVKPYMTVAAEGNVGDAQIMGAAIGAALGNMDTNWGLPAFIGEPFDPEQPIVFDIANVDWGVARAGAGCIIVNKEGKRFANEASAYAPFNRAFGNFSTNSMTFENLPAVWICDAKYVEAGGGLLPGQFASDPGNTDNELAEDATIPANFFQADTLEEIAEHFGINAEGLIAEVEKFNAMAEAGVDTDFHRGERASDFAIAAMHPYGEEMPNCSLAPIATPPFSASLYVPGTCGTNGGLVTNEKAQVLDVNGNVIEGLLAVGNCAASIMGGQYTGGGATLGAGAVMSYIGVKNLLEA